MTEDRLHRATRWKQFAEEDGGLFDMIDNQRRALFEKAGALPLKDTDSLMKLSIADKLLANLKEAVSALAAGAEIEAANRAAVEKVAALSPQRRRFF